MANETPGDYILGLDIGTNSIGWAVIAADEKPSGLEPNVLVASGVRVFEAGVEGTELDIQTGKDQSRGVDRRDARQHRRQLARRSMRMRNLFKVLQSSGLLPPGEDESAEGDRPTKEQRQEQKRKCRSGAPARQTNAEAAHARHLFFLNLDSTIRAAYADTPLPMGDLDALPYMLRARALVQKLEPFELGRALYHLAQRRGFLSNRKTAGKDKDEGKVKEGIEELRNLMDQANSKTLGQYFASIDPEQHRIRGRWTSRQMYLDEFEAIWSQQSEFHSDLLTPQLKERIQHAIFYQRPLKAQKGLIGKCELELDNEGKPYLHRAPWALLPAQRLRMLLMVNNTRIITPDGEILDLFADMPELKDKLVARLETVKELTFKSAKKLLGLQDHHINYETGGETKFVGDSTSARLKKIFGKDRWNELSPRGKGRHSRGPLELP